MAKKYTREELINLTSKEKYTLRKLYRIYCISSILCLVIGLIAGIFTFNHIGKKLPSMYELRDTQNELIEVLEDNIAELENSDVSHYFEATIAGENMELANVKSLQTDLEIEIKHTESDRISFALINGAVLGFICILVVVIVFAILKSKYPYFSEKNYKILKKEHYF